MSEENTEKEYKVGDGLAAYKNVPKDASGAIPSYAKALKLLRKKFESQDKVIDSLKGASKISFQLKTMSEADTGENLNHTNYVNTDNTFLNNTEAYQRKKVDTFPLELVKNHKFPIVPFGDDLMKGSNKTTLEEFSEIISKCDEHGLVLGKSHAGQTITKNGSSTGEIIATYELLQHGIMLDNAEFFNFLSTKISEGTETSFRQKTNTKNFSDIFGSKTEEYDVFFNYLDDGTTKTGSIIKVDRIDLTDDAENTTTYFYLFKDRNSPIPLNSNTNVRLYINPKNPSKTIAKAIRYDGKGNITSNFDKTVNYTNIVYEMPSLVDPNSIPMDRAGEYLTGYDPSSLPTTIDSGEIEAYKSGYRSEKEGSRNLVKKYKNLVDSVLSNLDDFYNNDNFYYFNYIEKLSNGLTGDNSKSVTTTCKLDDETKKYATISLDFVGFKPTLKRLIALTERDKHNDAQIAEVLINQKIDDDLLKEELFQIYNIKHKEGSKKPSVYFCENNKNIFSSAFNDYNDFNSSVETALKKSYVNKELDIDLFFNGLFNQSTSKYCMDNYYTIVESYLSYEQIGTHTEGILWWKKEVIDYGNVTRYRKSKTIKTVQSQPNILSATVEIKPTISEKISESTMSRDILEYNTSEHDFKLVNKSEYTRIKTLKDGQSFSGDANLTYDVRFANSGEDETYYLTYEKLFHFVEHYSSLISKIFENYDKNIASLSLLDILSNDIYGDERLGKKYYFTMPKVLEKIENSDKYKETPLLESLLNTITLEDSSTSENSDPSNTFKLTGNNGYSILSILYSDDILSKLISIN